MRVRVRVLVRVRVREVSGAFSLARVTDDGGDNGGEGENDRDIPIHTDDGRTREISFFLEIWLKNLPITFAM